MFKRPREQAKWDIALFLILFVAGFVIATGIAAIQGHWEFVFDIVLAIVGLVIIAILIGLIIFVEEKIFGHRGDD